MGQDSADSARALQAMTKAGANRATADSTQKARFGTYFPRVFACAYSLTGDEAAAKDVVSEAFSRVLPHAKDLGEEEFVVELFSTARDLVRASSAPVSTNGNLTGRSENCWRSCSTPA